MAALYLNVSDDTKALAESRAAAAGFTSVDQYVEALLRADAAAEAPELEALLLQRLDEGSGVAMDAADFEQMRDKLRARLAAGQGGP